MRPFFSWFDGDCSGLRVTRLWSELVDGWRVMGGEGAGIERWLVAAGSFIDGGLAVRRSRRGGVAGKGEW